MFTTGGKCFPSKNVELCFLGIFFQCNPIQWTKIRKQFILGRVTDFTERSSCSWFPYTQFFSPLKSASIQSAPHESHLPPCSARLLNVTLGSSAASKGCQPPVHQMPTGHTQGFLLHPRRGGVEWGVQVHTTVLALRSAPRWWPPVCAGLPEHLGWSVKLSKHCLRWNHWVAVQTCK